MIIKKLYYFHAAHRNPAGGEKCGRIHGHTYNVICYFNFSEIKNGGITFLFSDIDKLITPIIKEFDHYFILYKNDKLCNVLTLANEPFKIVDFETSAENLTIYFFEKIQNKTNLPIFKIELSETKTSSIIYENK